MTKKGGFRLNALPAKYSPLSERIQTFKDSNDFRVRKGYGRDKIYIGDICDFCKKNIQIKRTAMGLLKKGWKFICNDCYKKKGEPNLKENKLFIGKTKRELVTKWNLSTTQKNTKK